MGEGRPDELHFYPFAYALYNENLSAFCWYCLDEHKPHKRCVGCGTAMFCDKDCQTLAWKDHKYECRALKFNREAAVPDIEVRLLGRIVVRYKAILFGKDKEDLSFYRDRTSQRAIMDIWAHTKNISEDPFAMKKFNAIYEALLNFYEAKALLSRDVIFQLHCRDFINRHAISDKAYVKEVGKGLYLDLCAYDHSCRPNAIYICNGFRATLRPLSAETNLLNRSTTFYSYIDLLHAKQERHKLLKDTWYFHCECERCRDNQEHILTAINCPHCTASTPARLCLFGDQPYKDADTQLLTCPQCGSVVAREAVVEALATMRFVDEVIEGTQQAAGGRLAAIEFLEGLRDRVRRLLPDVNIYCCKIVQALIPLVDPHDNAVLLQLHLDVEECLRICYPHNHPALGFHLRNIGIFALRLGDRPNLQKSVDYLEEAVDIFAFVMRDEHSMTATTREFLAEARRELQKLRAFRSVDKSEAAETATAERSTERVMLRCEVFAESEDKGGASETDTEANTRAELAGCKITARIDLIELALSELKKTVTTNKSESATGEVEQENKFIEKGEETIEQNVELINCEAAAAVALTQNGGACPVWKKRKKLEYAGSLKRRSKKTTPSVEGHHHHHHRRHHYDHHHLPLNGRHHSETRMLEGGARTEEWAMPLELDSKPVTKLKEEKIGSDTISPITKAKQNALSPVDVLIIPPISCIITKSGASTPPAIPTFETLFVDTSAASPSQANCTQTSADSVGGRTGVKKKAALKKVSPRARTPLPPFKAASSEPLSPNPAVQGGLCQPAVAFPFVGSGLEFAATSEPTTADVELQSFSLAIPTIPNTLANLTAPENISIPAVNQEEGAALRFSSLKSEQSPKNNSEKPKTRERLRFE